MAAGGAFPTERRNIAARQHLVHRIIEEYEEMPGLHLTAAQAQRLFRLREDVCNRVLQALVGAAILRTGGRLVCSSRCLAVIGSAGLEL